MRMGDSKCRHAVFKGSRNRLWQGRREGGLSETKTCVRQDRPGAGSRDRTQPRAAGPRAASSSARCGRNARARPLARV